LNLSLNDSGEGNTTKLLHEEVSKVKWLARERRSRAGARCISAGLGAAVKEKKQWAGLVAGTWKSGDGGGPVASLTRV
jgi:hypothetical protein